MNARELSEMLAKVGVHMSEKVIRDNIHKGNIVATTVINPVSKRRTYEISAAEADRILLLYGKQWPRDPQGQGVLDPVGYLERKGKATVITAEGEE